MRSRFGSQVSPADAMSEGPKKLKYPSLIPTEEQTPDDEHRSAYLQLKVLTTYMATEFLGMKQEQLADLFQNFGTEDKLPRIRELYDFIIEAINTTPNAKMGRMKLDKMVNIFNAYSGITPDKRAFETAIGVKAFKAVGEYYEDGSYRKYARLTPAEPTSPTVQTPFPPTGGQADARGIVSYDSARGGREYTMAQVQADSY